MKVKTLQILWHEKQPVFSVDFEPAGTGRLATCGGDTCVRIWQIVGGDSESPEMEFLATLARHTAAVNCVRWSPQGGVLASGGDDGSILLWQQSESRTKATLEDDDENKQLWRVTAVLRGTTTDLYDLAWSPDGSHIMSACVDNTCRIYNVAENKCVHVITDHQHFVQGVAWDPLNQYLATQSSDRSVNVYSLSTTKTGALNTRMLARHSKIADVSKLQQNVESDAKTTITATNTAAAADAAQHREPATYSSDHEKENSSNPNAMDIDASEAAVDRQSGRETAVEAVADIVTQPPTISKPPKQTQTAKNIRLYHDETLMSFFRRLAFSPDGAILATPAGLTKDATETTASAPSTAISAPQHDATAKRSNAVYIYTRNSLNTTAAIQLTGHKTPSVAVRFNPNRYKLVQSTIERTGQQPYLLLPYRHIFAVATQDSVIVYDTQHTRPLAVFGNLHYATFTDVAWSSNGRTLIMASTDGFCSIAQFEQDELGEIVCAAQPQASIALADLPDADKPNVAGEAICDASAVDAESAGISMDNIKSMVTPALDTADQSATASAPAPKKRRIVPVFVGPLQ
eukprot:jgi/Hompol1/5520/HPOL_004504-RA